MMFLLFVSDSWRGGGDDIDGFIRLMRGDDFMVLDGLKMLKTVFLLKIIPFAAASHFK